MGQLCVYYFRISGHCTFKQGKPKKKYIRGDLQYKCTNYWKNRLCNDRRKDAEQENILRTYHLF